MHKYILIFAIMLGCLAIPSWGQDELGDRNLKQDAVAIIKTFTTLIVNVVPQKGSENPETTIRFTWDGDVRCYYRGVEDNNVFHRVTEITVNTVLIDDDMNPIRDAFRELGISSLRTRDTLLQPEDPAIKITAFDGKSRVMYVCDSEMRYADNPIRIKAFMSIILKAATAIKNIK